MEAAVEEREVENWGYHLRINAYGLNPKSIKSIKNAKAYIVQICDLIQMTRFGAPIVKRFGKDVNCFGITGLQMIEESNIAFHLVESTNRGFFDIFSCKEFDEERAIKFTLDFFGASDYTSDFTTRK